MLAAASVLFHLFAAVRLCATAEQEIRRVFEDRRERTQLRAADWQVNDMVSDVVGGIERIVDACVKVL